MSQCEYPNLTLCLDGLDAAATTAATAAAAAAAAGPLPAAEVVVGRAMTAAKHEWRTSSCGEMARSQEGFSPMLLPPCLAAGATAASGIMAATSRASRSNESSAGGSNSTGASSASSTTGSVTDLGEVRSEFLSAFAPALAFEPFLAPFFEPRTELGILVAKKRREKGCGRLLRSSHERMLTGYRECVAPTQTPRKFLIQGY
jgi:hypothetical protein